MAMTKQELIRKDLRKKISIMIVSYLPAVAENLINSFRYINELNEMSISCCESVLSIKHGLKVSILPYDFVIYIVNMTSQNALEDLEEDIHHLDPSYLMGRMCFLYPKRNVSEIVITTEELHKIAKSYSALALVGDLNNADKCDSCAKTILKYFQSIYGINTGIPIF